MVHILPLDLVLQGDRLDDDAEVAVQMITLPGEDHVFPVRTSVRADDPRGRRPLTVRCGRHRRGPTTRP